MGKPHGVNTRPVPQLNRDRRSSSAIPQQGGNAAATYSRVVCGGIKRLAFQILGSRSHLPGLSPNTSLAYKLFLFSHAASDESLNHLLFIKCTSTNARSKD
jgi:hypothetical protein